MAKTCLAIVKPRILKVNQKKKKKKQFCSQHISKINQKHHMFARKVFFMKMTRLNIVLPTSTKDSSVNVKKTLMKNFISCAVS